MARAMESITCTNSYGFFRNVDLWHELDFAHVPHSFLDAQSIVNRNRRLCVYTINKPTQTIAGEGHSRFVAREDWKSARYALGEVEQACAYIRDWLSG